MDSGKHKVPRKSRAGSHNHRFRVPDLAYHNNIRVLPKKRFQPGSKREVHSRIYLNLVNSRKRVFNRVFKGGNIYTVFLNEIQKTVKGRGFPGTRGTRGHYHAERIFHVAADNFFMSFRKT